MTHVAVGIFGTLLTSPDGVSWTSRDSGTTNSFNDVVRGEARWVAVGSSGTIVSSSDGIDWVTASTGTTSSFLAVATDGPTFVAVGAQGIIRHSLDGLTWTARASGTTGLIHDVSRNATQWLAVDANGAILGSPDAVVWTPQAIVPPNMRAAAYGNSQWVAVGGNGAPAVLLSQDGSTWTATAAPPPDGFAHVEFGGNRWVGNNGNGIYTTTDGANWVVGPSDFVLGIDYAGGQWFATGFGGLIRTSPDGVAWTDQVSGTTSWLTGVAGTAPAVAVPDPVPDPAPGPVPTPASPSPPEGQPAVPRENKAPVAVPVLAPGCSLTLTFHAASSRDEDGRVVAYQWEFEDAITFTEAAGERQFPGPGKYVVRLSVWDDVGAVSTTATSITLAECVPLRLVLQGTTVPQGEEARACAQPSGGLGAPYTVQAHLPPAAALAGLCVVWRTEGVAPGSHCVPVTVSDGQDDESGCLGFDIGPAKATDPKAQDDAPAPVDPVPDLSQDGPGRGDRSVPEVSDTPAANPEGGTDVAEAADAEAAWLPYAAGAGALVAVGAAAAVYFALRRRRGMLPPPDAPMP